MDIPDRAPYSTETGGRFRTLMKGPVIRSKEKNDEFIQSWLQQTQARHSRLPVSDELPPFVAEPTRSKADRTKHRKRSRPHSEASPPTPKTIQQLEHRFEKRARHKTREDKYEYKPRVRQRDVVRQEGRPAESGPQKRSEMDPYRSSKRGRVAWGINSSHLLRRASKPTSNINRFSEPLKRRASEPHMSKSRFSKSQKEDKEFEEISAFFSRNTSQMKYRDGPDDQKVHSLRSASVDIEHYRSPRRYEACSSLRNSQSSHGSVSASGDERRLPRSISSERFQINEGVSPVRRSRSSRPRSSSAWPQCRDVHNGLESHHTTGAQGPVVREIHQICHEAEATRTTERQVNHCSQVLGPTEAARKDAGSQTDLVIGKEGKLPKAPSPAEGKKRMSKDRHLIDKEDHRPVTSHEECTQGFAALPVYRELETWPAQKPTMVERGCQHRQEAFNPDRRGYSTEDSGFPIKRGVIDAGSRSEIRLSNRLGHCTGGRGMFAGDHPVLTTGYLGPTSRLFEIDRGEQEYGNSKTVRQDTGDENLEDFIRRIEGEAVATFGQGAQGNVAWVNVPNDFNVIGSPKFGSVERYEAGGYGDAYYQSVASNWDGLSWETDLLPANGCDSTALYADGNDFMFPDSAGIRESYPDAREEEYMALPWGQRGMI
ncbi:hypothetical protein VTK26DRAFT_4644 [Humicola hyalothermophila]